MKEDQNSRTKKHQNQAQRLEYNKVKLELVLSGYDPHSDIFKKLIDLVLGYKTYFHFNLTEAIKIIEFDVVMSRYTGTYQCYSEYVKEKIKEHGHYRSEES
jgi:hypothetical protein